jgi:BirA family biotin operon repressor/biotin-[acetyl-CoA-carboxylase] ligase
VTNKGFLKHSSPQSTNSALSELLSRGDETKAVYTLNQKAGKGTKGRQWVSLPGDSLAVSYRVSLENFDFPSGWIPLLVGRVVCEVLEELGAKGIYLKWPNDVMHGNKKLSGILIESINAELCVAGIGINLFSEEATLPAPEATSLKLLGVLIEDPFHQIVMPLYDALVRSFSRPFRSTNIFDAGELGDFVKNRMATVGKNVSFRDSSGRDRIGVAVDLGIDAALVVKADGSQENFHLYSEDVYHIQ